MAITSTEDLLSDAEAVLAPAVDAAFTEYLAQARMGMLGSLTADASASDLPPMLGGWPGSQLWARLVRSIIAPAVDAVFGTAFAATAQSDLLQVDAYRQSYVAQATDRLSASLWPDEAFTAVQGQMQEGVAAGESTPQLRARIASALRLDTFSYLADRIARTEAHAAVEGGNHASSTAYTRLTGIPMFQRWIATRDTRTRDTHRAASGQTVRLDEPFHVGGAALRYPGDPLGPPEETIQCRCSTLTGPLADLDLLPPSPADSIGASATMTVTIEETTAEAARPEPVRWRGILAPLETRGDYRVLGTPDGARVPTNDMMWLAYQSESGDGHDGKVTVGRITRAWVQDGDLWGEGDFDVNDETGTAQRVIRLLRDGFAGTVSIDLSDGDFTPAFYDAQDRPIEPPADPEQLESALERGDIKELLYVTDWRLGGATLVQDPAFHTARIHLVEELSGSLTAAAVGDLTLPLAERDREWDGAAAKRRLAEAGRLNQGTFWRDDDADPDSDVQADYRLPFADIINGELRAVPRAIFAVASVLQGGMGGVDLPAEAQDRIRDRVEDYYDRMRDTWDDDTIRAPWDDEDEDDMATGPVALAAAATSWAERVAATVPVEPPAKWFSDPKLTGLTKLQVTDEGRVYGHIADWSQKHIGFLGERIYPPRDPHQGAYRRFHRNPVRTAEGTRINTGPLTSGGHAATDASVSMASAMAHYDDPRFVLANVVAGEDEYGIWVAGALRPGVEPWQVSFADTYAFSGDWRDGELIAACTVSVPGFHVPNDPSVVALAASAGVSPAPARVRQRLRDGHASVLLSAGVVAPTRYANGGAPLGMHRIADQVAEGTRSLSKQIADLPENLEELIYTTVQRAMRDEREMAELARLVSSVDVTEALAVFGTEGR